jgi:PIN domain nuclease of toxin-antitoxin system
MDLLLDACAFIWWDSGGGLSSVAAAALQDPANRLHLSLASLWEMQIKHCDEVARSSILQGV